MALPQIRPGPTGPMVRQLLPRLRVLNPAGGIIAWIIERALREVGHHLLAYLNGLSFIRMCRLTPSSGFLRTSTLGNCLVNQAGVGRPMGELSHYVQTGLPGQYIKFMGFSHIVFPSGLMRYAEQSTYRITGTRAAARVGYAPPIPHAYPRYLASPLHRYWRATEAPPEIRPWPIWRAPVIPEAIPAPSPTPDTGGRVGGRRGTRVVWDGTDAPPTVRPIVDTPSVARAVPRLNEKEAKIGANSPAAQLFFNMIKARELVSEMMDVVKVMYSALPRGVRRSYGYGNASDAAMIAAVMAHIEDMDALVFLQGMLANTIEDAIIGGTWFKARGRLRNDVYGGQFGSLGPVENQMFLDYAKNASDVASWLAQLMTGGREFTHSENARLGAAADRLRKSYNRMLDRWRERDNP